jgi:opacity protein-like surface antigen
MKKLLFVLVIASLVLGNAFAFDFMKASPALGDQKININLGVGYGLLKYDIAIPPVSIDIAYRLDDMIGIPLSIGAYAGFTTTDNGGNESSVWGNWSETMIAFGLKAKWHFHLFDFMDTYIGVTLGYMLWETVNVWTSSWSGIKYTYTYTYDQFFYAANLGLRFFFTDNIGLYLELGYSAITVASLGLALKF